MSGSDHERRVDEAIAAYLQACEKGEPPQREAFLAAHADVRDELGSFLDNREMLRHRADPDETLGSGPATVPPLGSARYFGDYELLEEVARGGMGVVYKSSTARA